jgi:glycosyltransferase involved in cell wall biosynthesis
MGLYVGRIDEPKGCAAVIDYFIRWKKEYRANHKLLLLGTEVMPTPFHHDIVYLGFVDDEQKWAAMKSCDWLIMPSPYESLSMVLLESWSVGRPALVNGECSVLTRHGQESNGDIWYRDSDEWSAALTIVDEETEGFLAGRARPMCGTICGNELKPTIWIYWSHLRNDCSEI